MRLLKSGIKRLVFQQIESLVFTVILRPVNVITSGNMAQDLVDHVLRSIMIVVKNMAVAVRTVKWDASVIVSWKYGTTYLPSFMVMAKVAIVN